jgi:hypothetical protein
MLFEANGTANAAHCLPRWAPYPKPFKQTGLPFFTSFKTSSQKGTLPKAFQTNTACSFGFFNAHPLNQASLFRVFALKKPLICMRGFVANIGASLEEFAGDIRAILDAKLKNR